MTATDFIYKEAAKQFRALGYEEHMCAQVGAEAIRKYRRGNKAVNAIEQAVAEGKKSAKRPAK